MRKISVILLVIAALALALGVAGCGGGSSAEGVAPQQVLGSALTASQTLNSATGTFSVSIDIDADTTEMPDEAKAMFDEPMTISGTFASGSAQAMEADLALGIAGETMNFALKASETNAWLRLNDTWYETPPEFMEAMGESASVDVEAKLAEIMKLISDLGVDPTTWIKDMTITQEKLNGVETYHIKGIPDVAKMLTDYAALMQSEEFVNAIGSATDVAAGTGMDLGEMIPSPDELQETQDMVNQMFKDATIDLWIGKDDSLPRQMALVASIVPPAEEADGLNAIKLNATVSLQSLNEDVSIEAPDSALPFADLEKAMEENPEAIFGPLGGLLGGFGAGF